MMIIMFLDTTFSSFLFATITDYNLIRLRSTTKSNSPYNYKTIMGRRRAHTNNLSS